MRRLFWLLVFLAGLGCVAAPATYFYIARDLPDLDSPEVIRKAVAFQVEAQRRATSVVKSRYEDVSFQLTPVSELPKVVVSAVVAFDGCPDYVTGRKERGFPLQKRLFKRALGRSMGPRSPALCHLMYADRVASAIGIVDNIQSAIAMRKIHDVLSPDELLAYRLSTVFYSTKVIGVRDASKALFKKDISELNLSQLGELFAAENNFNDFAKCINLIQLKILRDNVIDGMEAFKVISADDAKVARARPTTCALKPY